MASDPFTFNTFAAAGPVECVQGGECEKRREFKFGIPVGIWGECDSAG